MRRHVDQAFWDFVSTWDNDIGIDMGITWHSVIEGFTGGVDERCRLYFWLLRASRLGMGPQASDGLQLVN